jgi:hypothetical protein
MSSSPDVGVLRLMGATSTMPSLWTFLSFLVKPILAAVRAHTAAPYMSAGLTMPVHSHSVTAGVGPHGLYC